MKRFSILLVAVLTISFTTAFSLPNFWYSAVAYNAAGQVITTGPLAQVDVTITDGTNSAPQTFFGVPVDEFGIFNIYITAAGSVNMVAGTQITVKVNGVTVAGAPLTSIIYNGYHFGDYIDLDSEVAGILPDANVADDLTINGGTINNTVIGGTTPADGTFENLYVPNGETDLSNGSSTKPITLRVNANGAESNAIVAVSSNAIDNEYATIYAAKASGGDGAVAWFEDSDQSGGGSVLYSSNTLNPPSTSNHVAEIQSAGFADAALLVNNDFAGGKAIEAYGRVSIGTSSTGTGITSSQVTVLNTDLSQGITALNKVAVTSVPWWTSAIMGIDSSNSSFGSGIAGFYSGHIGAAGVYGRSSKDVDYSSAATIHPFGYIGGEFMGGDCGIVASGGVIGTGEAANKYGIYAMAGVNPTSWAGYFNGRIAVKDGTEGNGKVLTSDASGNASWQDQNTQSVGISMFQFTSNLTIPPNTATPITQWKNIANEDGGANYNSSTGEYTITVAGVYQVNAQIIWSSFATPAECRIWLYINSAFFTESIEQNNSSLQPSQISLSKRFNVGDKISFYVIQYSASNQTILGPFNAQYYSVQYLHK